MRGLADRGPRVGDFHGPRTAAYIYIYTYMRFFFLKKWRSWYFYALCVCDALPQALFFRKN